MPRRHETRIYQNTVVMSIPRQNMARVSRRAHYLMPQQSTQEVAHTILRGMVRNQALLVIPAAVQVI